MQKHRDIGIRLIITFSPTVKGSRKHKWQTLFSECTWYMQLIGVIYNLCYFNSVSSLFNDYFTYSELCHLVTDQHLIP